MAIKSFIQNYFNKSIEKNYLPSKNGQNLLIQAQF